MPEWYDHREAERLHDDAAAIVAEADGVGDALLHRLLFEAELAGADAARDALAASVEARKIYYLDVAALWSFLAEGIRESDMAKIRGAYAGLRTATMKELARDPIAQTLNHNFKEERRDV